MQEIAFFGFGEARQAICAGLQHGPVELKAYDLKLTTPGMAVDMRQAMTALNATPLPLQDLGQSSGIFCLVTADQALAAAQAAAAHLCPGALWLDGNSCAPSTKRRASDVIEAAGGRYVDLAIMAPVHPHLHRTPVLVSGPHSAAALVVLSALGMQAQGAGGQIGQASSIKMLRSVIIKGFEALTAEAFLGARAAGVEDAVIASLNVSDPGIDWAARGSYNLDRMLVHGARRAAEMREVAATIAELGLPNHVSAATVPWQAALAGLGLDPGPDDLAARADMILHALQ